MTKTALKPINNIVEGSLMDWKARIFIMMDLVAIVEEYSDAGCLIVSASESYMCASAPNIWTEITLVLVHTHANYFRRSFLTLTHSCVVICTRT